MRKLSYLLALPLVALAACSQGDLPDAPVGATGGETGKVVFNITRASADAFTSAGIDEMTVLLYKVVKKETTLDKELTVRPGDPVEFEFPLGSTYRTVVFANAQSVTDKEDINKLCLHLDPKAQKEVWCTSMTRFNSDRTVGTLNLELGRVVAQVKFRPVETGADLEAIDKFDEMNLTFTQTGTDYYPATGTCTPVDYTLNVKKADGFTGSFYTFRNLKAEKALVTIEYLKGGAKVNESSALETNVIWEANHSYTVSIPLSSSDYANDPWLRPSLNCGLQIIKTSL